MIPELMPGLPHGLTQGTLLDGRVRYAQPAVGYRTGLEPVLLAATVPVRVGERVLEAGTGAGAGLLCLLARVPGVMGLGLEIDPATAGLARANIAANGLAAAIHIGDVADAARLGPVDHAFANPPWHDPAGTTPPEPGRARAKHLGPDGLSRWIDGLSRALAPRGTLSLIVPAALLARALAALEQARFGAARILPLWPRAGVAARIVIVQARRGASGTVLLPGLVLHEGAGLSAAAERVLRAGDGLAL